MKTFLIGQCMNIIRKEKPELTDVKLEEIEYGLTGIYLSVTKIIVISILAIILGTFKELLCFMLIFAIIRTNAYGIHLSKSSICLIVSSIAFLGIPWLALQLTISLPIKIIIGVVVSLIIFKYSPADTHKRPIISKAKRKRHKILATLTSIIFVALSIFLENNFLSNCFLMSLLLISIMIIPITYRIFKLPYNNYLKYVS